jgi:hypothetical protein
MNNLDFIKKLYNGKNCYSDHMTGEQLNVLHLKSEVENIIIEKVNDRRIVFLTGNPGDGKTFIIQAIKNYINQEDVYIERDLNTISDYTEVSKKILAAYNDKRGAIIAVNEYPFYLLLKSIKSLNGAIYERIKKAKDSFLVYGIPTDSVLENNFYVIDLNYRNLLFSPVSGENIPNIILDKMCTILKEETVANEPILKYNVEALSIKHVRSQLTKLIDYAILNNEHFAARDIFGAFSYVMTSGLAEDTDNNKYYDAVFLGDNPLLRAIQQYDPIFLSSPELDEYIWNGDDAVRSGWLLDCPEIWPGDAIYQEKVDDALNCFKSIKRKYFFENTNNVILNTLLYDTVERELNIFKNFEDNKRAIKIDIVNAINKIFLNSPEKSRDLRIWTTHRYDLSYDSSTAISSKFVDSRNLELILPHPSKWAEKIEYVPNHLILRMKRTLSGKDNPQLDLDVDFLLSLKKINAGYPAVLLPTQYEQAISMFLQQLDEQGFSEDNDGEFIIANRKNGFKMRVNIENNKYSFE